MFENALPCIVELMGHNRIAGKVSEQSLGGTNFIRIDVPDVDGVKGFTKLYGATAIYAITPTDEATMQLAVKAFRTVPVEPYEFKMAALAATNQRREEFESGVDEMLDDDADNDRLQNSF